MGPLECLGGLRNGSEETIYGMVGPLESPVAQLQHKDPVYSDGIIDSTVSPVECLVLPSATVVL